MGDIIPVFKPEGGESEKNNKKKGREGQGRGRTLRNPIDHTRPAP